VPEQSAQSLHAALAAIAASWGKRERKRSPWEKPVLRDRLELYLRAHTKVTPVPVAQLCRDLGIVESSIYLPLRQLHREGKIAYTHALAVTNGCQRRMHLVRYVPAGCAAQLAP
jgi:hypothetical protein